MSAAIKYELKDIRTSEIYIDELGQRDVERRKGQFNKIMREFDPNLVQPISVALIDGRYYCFDGQMTMKVLKARNGDKDLCVKCRVYHGMTKMDAANMFINQRGTVSAVKLTDKIRVLGNYGDQKSLDFQRITENNGLEISWTGRVSKNAVLAVSTLWSEFNNMNDNEMFAMMIRVIRKSWNGDPEGSQAKIIRGLSLFLRTYKDQSVNEDRLVRVLGRVRPNEIIRNASVDRSSGARKYAVQILQLYNSGLRQDKKLPNIL